MSLPTIIFLPGVVFLLGAREPQWIAMTKSYLIGYAIGVPYYTMTRILKMYLEMDGRYLRLNIAYILTTVIDVIGDALVIFFFNKSMLGIGLATSVGYIIPFIIIAMYFFHLKTPSMFRISCLSIPFNAVVHISP